MGSCKAELQGLNPHNREIPPNLTTQPTNPFQLATDASRYWSQCDVRWNHVEVMLCTHHNEIPKITIHITGVVTR